MKGFISNLEIYISYPKAISYHGCDMQQVMRQAVRVMLWRVCFMRAKVSTQPEHS